MFKQYFQQIGIDPVTKTRLKQISNHVAAKQQPRGMTLEEFELIRNSVKVDLLVVEFKPSADATSIVSPADLQHHKQRIYHIQQVFNSEDVLPKKFGVEKCPDLVVIKLKGDKEHWTNGLESLSLILRTIEAQE